MSAPQRIFWLDAAKAYGMFLVYYGHIVERFRCLSPCCSTATCPNWSAGRAKPDRSYRN